MYHWSKSEERLNRYVASLQEKSLSFLIYYWGAVHHLPSNILHKHSFFEICYVNSGTGIYTEGDTIYPLYEGVTFCSRPNIYHQITDVDSLDLLYVAFEPDEKHSTAEVYERYYKALGQDEVCVDHSADSPTIQIWKSLLIPTEESRALAVSLLPQLAHALLASFPALLNTARNPELLPISMDTALIIQRAKLYIRDNLRPNLSLPEVAQHLNISKRQLSRLFASSIHESFSLLVRTERIRAAEQLLVHTNDPIKDIAERTGFSSVHYFTRTFALAKGIPPAAFREASR
jgi:AraC-like DNA-binding protein/mannose-6-phosphate isomerase-like protein (cupin superfamily)